MADSTLATLGAVKSLLKADAGVSGLVSARVHTDVPEKEIFPYVAFGPITTESEDVSCHDGNIVFLQIDVWSRKPGPAECLRILRALDSALHFQELTVTGHDTVLMSVDNSRHFRDADGLTHHGVIRFRVITQSK